MTVTTTATTATSTTKRSRWPVALAGMIFLHAAAMVTVILVATRDPSFAVEPNHYQKALAWDAFSARNRASQALGWKATARTDAGLDANGTRGLEMDIADREGNPVRGARAALLAFPHARGEERMRVDLAETAPGHYTTRAGMVRTGIWELRLVAQRGDDSFTTTLLHSVGAVP
jgi:nitrogen fixation protein FixH